MDKLDGEELEKGLDFISTGEFLNIIPCLLGCLSHLANPYALGCIFLRGS